MRRSWRHDWRLGLGALMMLLAYGGIAPQARAGCEQPVAITWPNDGTQVPAGFDAMSGAAPYTLLHHSAPVPQPCKGPHCSQAPLAPLAPPLTTIAPSQEWACFSLVSDGAVPQGTAPHQEDDPHQPIFRTFRIYHPPR